MTTVLGLICHGWHESAAVLVSDGSVIAAAEEERFTRRKFDNAFPIQAIRFCLASAGITAKDLDSLGKIPRSRRLETKDFPADGMGKGQPPCKKRLAA